jgi:hypothetical protein
MYYDDRVIEQGTVTKPRWNQLPLPCLLAIGIVLDGWTCLKLRAPWTLPCA